MQISKVELRPNRKGLSQELLQVYSASIKKKAEHTRNFSSLIVQTGLEKMQQFCESSGFEMRKLEKQGKGCQKELALVEEQYVKVFLAGDRTSVA